MPAKVISLIPLDLETRATLTTQEAAGHLNRAPQTLRLWCCKGLPKGLHPIRVNGRLAWPVSDLKAILGVQ